MNFFKLQSLSSQNEEGMQRAAWRLVRSAEDRMGSGTGNAKLMWAVDRLKKEFPLAGDEAEDHIRAAYMNFKIEQSVLRRQQKQ